MPARANFCGKKWVAGSHSIWFLAASNLMWTTMELIMSTTFYTPATIRVRSRGSGLIATVKTWWMSYLTRRIERAAIIQLHGMSERELQDIGLTRSQIERAVRGELDDGRQGRGCDGERRTLQSRAGDHYPTNGLGPPGNHPPLDARDAQRSTVLC